MDPDPEILDPAGSGSQPDPDILDPAGSGSQPDPQFLDPARSGSKNLPDIRPDPDLVHPYSAARFSHAYSGMGGVWPPVQHTVH